MTEISLLAVILAAVVVDYEAPRTVVVTRLPSSQTQEP